jgi:hypothetical protein
MPNAIPGISLEASLSEQSCRGRALYRTDLNIDQHCVVSRVTVANVPSPSRQRGAFR